LELDGKENQNQSIMRKILVLCTIALLLSSCALHSGLTFNTNNNVTNVVLQGNNYKIVQKVQGTASGVSVLGIGGPFRAIVAKARSEMLKNANLVGHSRAIINETVEVNSKYFVLFGVKTITVSAYVIEFTDNVQQFTQGENTQRQEIQQQEPTSNSTTTHKITPNANAYKDFNEYKNATPSLYFDFQLKQRPKPETFFPSGIANYEITEITPKTDTKKIDYEIWGIQVNGIDYVNSYSFTGIEGYNRIEGKGYYSYFIGFKGDCYVILPTGKIQNLGQKLLLELCKDNENIIKEIQGTKIKDKDFNKMFEILRRYNLTKE